MTMRMTISKVAVVILLGLASCQSDVKPVVQDIPPTPVVEQVSPVTPRPARPERPRIEPFGSHKPPAPKPDLTPDNPVFLEDGFQAPPPEGWVEFCERNPDFCAEDNN